MTRSKNDNSYIILFEDNYGKTEVATSPNNEADNELKNKPLSNLRIGLYDYESGKLNYRTMYGYYWESSISNSRQAYNLRLGSTYFSSIFNYSKGFGFSLRCVAKLKNSSAFYGSLL